MIDSPLLLTATIIPQSSELLKLLDPKVRYTQYIENLVRFITNSPFRQFIFCENSLAPISDRGHIEGICHFYGKEIEFLSFK
jgi:hypothetical protein